MKIQTIEYYFHEVLVSMVRKRWMTFASIGTVAVSLFVLGVFLILVMNINKMASLLESQVQISVYINDNLPEAGRKEIERMTRDLKSVANVEYVPREKALKVLQAIRAAHSATYGWKEIRGYVEELPNGKYRAVREHAQYSK